MANDNNANVRASEEELLGEARQTHDYPVRFSDGSDQLIGRPYMGEYSFTASVGAADPARIT